MSAPILADTYSFLLNDANLYTHEELLRPPIQNYTHCRVIASTTRVILQINCLRPSAILSVNAINGWEQIEGTCIPSDKTWFELNTTYIDRIQAGVYKFFEPKPDSISVTLQFQNFVPDQ